MVELFVRLSVCLVFLGVGALGLAPLDIAWKLAAFGSVLSLLGWILETRSLKNPGIAGFFAIGEAFLIALLFASAPDLHQLAFLVLVPLAYAAHRFDAPVISMAPLAASALVGADCAFSKTGIPAPQTLVQAAGVLAVCLILAQRRTIPHSTEVETALYHHPPVDDGMLQVRESYRKLRDAYSDLERRSRKDKVTARLSRATGSEGDRFFNELMKAIRDLTGAGEIAIYTLAQYDRVLVVRSVTEHFPRELKTSTLDIDVTKAQILVREQAEEAIAALAVGAAPCSVLLAHGGRVIGMICTVEPDFDKAESIRSELTLIAADIAGVIAEELERDATTRRLRELELLYEMNSVVSGAMGEQALASRLVHELAETLKLDGIAITTLDNGKERALAHHGSKTSLLDVISFAEGPGLQGWIDTGAPELVLFDARQDRRCDSEQTLRRRIGSYYLAPIWTAAKLYGYLCATTQIVGGIDVDQIAALRLASAEYSRALERVGGESYGGLMTPQEFAAATKDRQGALVYLEPLRREQMLATYGLAAFEHAIRKLAHQIRAKLPEASCLCKRGRGDFVAFLATDEEFARKWANEAAATASMIGYSTGDKRPVPLALRAKVAAIGTHCDEVLKEVAA